MRKPLLTNEHGAWVILLTPIASVFLYNGSFGFSELLFLLTALSCFLVYKPGEILLAEYMKRGAISSKNSDAFYWLKIYGIIAIALIAVLLLWSGHYVFSVFGFILFIIFGISKTLHVYGKLLLVRNLLGVFILTSGSILGDYYIHGEFTKQGVALWLLNFFYFAGASLFVEGKIAGLKVKGSGSSLRKLYYAGIILFLLVPVALSLAKYIVLLPGLIAFLPLAIHVYREASSIKQDADFKSTGIALTVYSIIFLLASYYAV